MARPSGYRSGLRFEHGILCFQLLQTDTLHRTGWDNSIVVSHDAVIADRFTGAAPPNLLIIHSDGDQVVSGKATDDLEQSWKQVAELVANASEWKIDGEAFGVPWTMHGYTNHGQQRLVRIGTPGFPHGWLGGPEGQHSSPAAPYVSGLIWWHLNASVAIERDHVVSRNDELLKKPAKPGVQAVGKTPSTPGDRSPIPTPY